MAHKRIEIMEKLTAELRSILIQYEDGLTSDIECFSNLLSSLANVQSDICVCHHCRTHENVYKHSVKDESGMWVPCCRDCYVEHTGEFICVWGEGYINHADPFACKVENHKFSFFTDENGYDQTDIAAVKALELGQSVTMGGNETHTVVRIK